MQVTLFKALKSIKVEDDAATAVVASLEEHVEAMIGDSTRALEAQLKGISAENSAFKSIISTQIDVVRDALQDVKASQSRQTTFLGAMIAIVGLAIAASPIVAKFIH